MKFRLVDSPQTISGAYAHYSTPIDFGSVGGDSYSVEAEIDVDTPGAKTFASTAVDVTADTITIAAHGYTLGLKGQVSNPGTLPTGITAVTDYFVIVVDANTIKLASSLVNAQAGTAIDITGQGAGTNTFTPTALAGGTIKLQQSNKYNPATGVGTWADLGSATNITADATVYLEKDRPTSRWIRVAVTVTAGHVTSVLNELVKGDKE